MNSICIEDFCGFASNHIPCQFWADYFPDEKLVKFGGDWEGVSDMFSQEIPNDQTVWDWVKIHNGIWWEN